MSDKESESEHELTKEERLEAARKKFEEAKEKKKKKKKKASKETKDTEATPEPTEATPEVVVPSEVIEPTEKVASEEPVEAEFKDTGIEAIISADASAVQTPEPTAEVPQAVESNAETDLLIASLKATVEQQKETIRKLRDENTDLKLGRMDLNDKIAELEASVATLSSGAAAVSPVQQEKPVLKPAKPVFTTNDYASASQQALAMFENTADFRERLMVWKGWQVDMTAWNSTTFAPKVAL